MYNYGYNLNKDICQSVEVFGDVAGVDVGGSRVDSGVRAGDGGKAGDGSIGRQRRQWQATTAVAGGGSCGRGRQQW